MTCPRSSDYFEAVQNLGSCMRDEELLGGRTVVDEQGLPTIWSGGFADVYKIECPDTGNVWALKCFTREVADQRERYREISSYLDQVRLPFAVDFQYLESGIRIGNRWHPILKMRWVEGVTLNQFVEKYVDKPKNIDQLLTLWRKMARRLLTDQIAHADLQHGNVLLVPRGNQLALRLIDYDGMHVPALAGRPSGELGHPAYQHPQRLREGTYSIEVDRFSHLAIYCALRCLRIGGRRLWDKFNNADNLLFRESDYRAPGNSRLFRAIWESPNADLRTLGGRLAMACLTPLAATPLLDEIVAPNSDRTVPLTVGEEKEIRALLLDRSSVVVDSGTAEQPSAPPAEEPKPESEPPTKTAAKSGEETPVAVSKDAVTLAETELSQPTSYPQRAWTLVRAAFALDIRESTPQVGHALLALFRFGDGLLLRIVGRDNTILHNFVRISVIPPLIVVLGFLAWRFWPVLPRMEPEVIEVQPPQVAPVRMLRLKPIASQAVEAGKQLRLAMSVADAETWRGKVHYGFVGKEPIGAKIDPDTGAFTWTPSQSQMLQTVKVAVTVAAEDKSDRTEFSVRVTDPAANRLVRKFQGHAGQVTCVAFSGDGRRVLTGSEDKTAILWDAVDAKQVHVFREHKSELCCVAFSPDNEFILTVSRGRSATVQSIDMSHSRIDGFSSPEVQSAVFSPDGSETLIGTTNAWTLLRGVLEKSKRHEILEWQFSAEALAFSPNGQQILGGGRSRDNPACTAILWDTATHRAIQEFVGHNDTVCSVAFSPDGQKVVTGSRDGTAILWNVANGDQIFTLYEGTDRRNDSKGSNSVAVAFSPDGRTILTARPCDDGAVLWDATTGQKLFVFSGQGPMQAVAFSPDGQTILTGATNGVAVLWSTEPSKPPVATPPVANVAKTVLPPLRLQPIPPQTVEMGDTMTVDMKPENAEAWHGKLRFSLGPNAPKGATIDPTSGQLAWTPTNEQVSGMHQFTVLVHGRENQETQASFTATVVPPKQPAWGEKEIALALGAGVKLEVVLIPAGEFQMADENGKPIRSVRITKPFYLGKYHITQEQWQTIMEHNPSHFVGLKNPVESVAWVDCVAFARKLDGRLGVVQDGFRLPTEAEWEYACRAGATPNVQDERRMQEFGWVSENSQYRTHPVGERKPNAWGLYEMRGNVQHWCADWYGSLANTADFRSDWPDARSTDPTGPSDGSHRVVRGCAWNCSGREYPIGCRQGWPPSGSNTTIGFRVACSTHPRLGGSPETARTNATNDRKTDRVTSKPLVVFKLPNGLQGGAAVAFSPNGKQLLTSGEWDCTPILWDTEGGKPIRQFQDHKRRTVNSIAFSDDGRQVLCGCSPDAAILWEVETGNTVHRFVRKGREVRSVAFRPGHSQIVAVFGRDATVWNTDNGSLVRTIPNVKGPAVSAAFSFDGHQLLVGEEGAAVIWNSDKQQRHPIRVLDDVTGPVRSVALSADGKRVFGVASMPVLFNENLKADTGIIWDAQSGDRIQVLNACQNALVSAAFSHDGKRILTGLRNGTAVLWDAETARELRTFAGHGRDVTAVALSLDGKRAVTYSKDGTAMLWDADVSEVNGRAPQSDGRNVAALKKPNEVNQPNIDGKAAESKTVLADRQIRVFAGHTSAVRAVAFSPDGKQILTGSHDTTGVLWNKESGTKLHVFSGYNVDSVAFSSNGELAVTGADKVAVLWDVATGKKRNVFDRARRGGIQFVKFSPDDRSIVTWDQSSTGSLWDVYTGDLIHEFKDTVGHGTVVAFSPDGKYAITGSGQGAFLWDTGSNALMRTLFREPVWSIAFDDSGQRAICGLDRSRVVILNVDTGRQLGDVVQIGKPGAVYHGMNSISSVVFDSSGWQVLAANQNTAFLWNTNTNRLIHAFECGSPIHCIAFGPNGKEIVTGDDRGRAILWDADFPASESNRKTPD